MIEHWILLAFVFSTPVVMTSDNRFARTRAEYFRGASAKGGGLSDANGLSISPRLKCVLRAAALTHLRADAPCTKCPLDDSWWRWQ